MNLTQKHTIDLIRSESQRLGFDDIGFSPATELSEDKERLQKWLSHGYNAGMGYMSNHFEKRINPALLVEDSLSVITVLKNYFPSDHKLSQTFPKISRYAYGIDYHDVIKDKLAQLFNYIRENIHPGLNGRFFTDSAPLLERSLAVKAGLGWIGKNSMLIHRKLGSYVFIGEIVVNLELPFDDNFVPDCCGNCTRCIDSCPTSAILPDRLIDANRCLSYQSIENKGEIPDSFKAKFNDWVFGCDICQEVCPWNRKAKPHSEAQFDPSQELKSMSSSEWETLTPEHFASLFRKSAIKRAKFEGLMRNIHFVKTTNTI